jgi:uncharacterized membrane protein YhfC
MIHGLVVLPEAGMLAVAAGCIAFWVAKHRVAPVFFFWGAFVFVVGTLAKATCAWATPAVETTLGKLVPRLAGPALWLYTGILTGVFECGVTLVFASRVKRLRQANWSEAVAFGVGFGSAEAIAIAVASLVLVALGTTMPELRPELPPEYQILTSPASTAEYLAPGLERLCAVALHTFASTLIIHAIKTRAQRWFWLAFAYKSLIDALPVEALGGRNFWFLLIPYWPFAIAGIVGIWILKERWQGIAVESQQQN